MSTALTLRSNRPKPMMNKVLKKRNRLSVREGMKVYPGWILGGLTLPLEGVGIPMEAIHHGTLSYGLMISAGIVTLIGGIVTGCFISESTNFDQDDRRRMIMYYRSLNARPHKTDELSRLRELDDAYSRYAVWTEREGTGISVSIIQYDPNESAVFFPYRARKSKLGYDGAEYSDSPIAKSKISEPTVEKVMEAVYAMQEKAEALENESYSKALKCHRMDCIALATQPPPADPRTRAKVSALDWEAELDEHFGKEENSGSTV